MQRRYGDIEYEIQLHNAKRIAVIYDAGKLCFHIPSNKIKKSNKTIDSFLQYNYDHFIKKKIFEQEALDTYKSIHGDRIFVFNHYIDIKNASIQTLSHILLQCTKPIITELSASMQLQCPHIKISYTKGYLGKCNIKKRIISIDYRNILCDIALLRYVITHELSHLSFPNHSKEFWEYADRFYPQSKKTTKLLQKQIAQNTIILDYYGLLPDSYKVIRRIQC